MKTTLVLLTLSVASAASASTFKFQVPPGWLDLSPGAPEANFAKLPPALVQQVRGGNFAFYAADIAHADDGFMENANASLVAGTQTITQQFLDQMMAQMNDEVGKQAPGMTIEVLEKKLVEINGVTCGRTVAVMKGPDLKAKQVQYVLPGQSEAAVITYSTTPEKFAEYEPVFDTAARATTGIKAPRTVLQSAGRGALFGGIAGAVAVLAMGLVTTLRKKRSK
jgi:hypothetical protein